MSKEARARDDFPSVGLDFPSVKWGWCCRLPRGLVCAKALGVVPGLRKCPSTWCVFTSSWICIHSFNKLDTCVLCPICVPETVPGAAVDLVDENLSFRGARIIAREDR